MTYASDDGATTIPLRVVPGRTERLPASLGDKVDPSAWLGKDGRPAEVVLLGDARSDATH